MSKLDTLEVNYSARDQLKLVIVGHVDHGKSTLIGRLLYETDSLPAEKTEELRTMSTKRGMPLEWSFVLDAFQAERDQAITIDTTQIWLRQPLRDIVIIDAPGHREFLRNMISGAAQADAAVLVVDAVEGVREQTRRHTYLLKLLGVGQIVVAINKIDMVEDAEKACSKIADDLADLFQLMELPVSPWVPISARNGVNLTSDTQSESGNSEATPWYVGPALLDTINGFNPKEPASNRAMRFAVQDVYKFDERRIVVGKVTSGTLSVGDTIEFARKGSSARVVSLESFGEAAPQSVGAGLTGGLLLDEQIFVERGDIASHAEAAPSASDIFRGRIFWLAERQLKVGETLKGKFGYRAISLTVDSIENVVNLTDLSEGEGDPVTKNSFANVIFRSPELIQLEPGNIDPAMGRFVLLDGTAIVGGGLVDLEGFPNRVVNPQTSSTNVERVSHLVNRETREGRNGHKGMVIWLTGLSGSGKSTIALAVERELFSKGYQVFALDGDNLRHGLNGDLGFSPDDRAENIRRAGEVSALLARSGMVVISAFISPYRADRQQARNAAAGNFSEVHINAPVEVCEERDVKGLYAKARRGEIADFTGISAPYEEPDEAELVLNTGELSVEESVDKLLKYITEQTKL